MVVYANEQGGRFGGSQSAQIEEGAAVRERQTILRLPDLSQMQVKVNVHESKVELLGDTMKKAFAAGQEVRARIRILDRELQGTLASIANQPEPSGWWSGNIKEYGTIIKIDGTPDNLRPGMTAECEILIEHLKDVLTVPVAAVVELKGKYLAWVVKDGKFEERPLVLGATNDQFVEVKDGLLEGEEVILNPRAMIPEARDSDVGVEEVDVTKKFGKERSRPAERAAGRHRPRLGRRRGRGWASQRPAPVAEPQPAGPERRWQGDERGDARTSPRILRPPGYQRRRVSGQRRAGGGSAADAADGRSRRARGTGWARGTGSQRRPLTARDCFVLA